MKRKHAKRWYHYMFDGNMTNFDSYYSKYKNWFDANKLEEKIMNWNCSFVDCPCEATTAPTSVAKKCPCVKEEGKTPMRYDNTAIATVAAPKSDIAVSREYFSNRLCNMMYSKENELHKLFNLGVDPGPKNFVDLIDAIKNDKFTIDKKVQKSFDEAKEEDRSWYYGMAYGIIWDGPKPDYDGFEKAQEEMGKQLASARDAIMAAATAADMKAAIEAFEAWLPVKADTAQ